MDSFGSNGGRSNTDWQVSSSHATEPHDTSDQPFAQESKDTEVKVVVLGAPGVGKTAIVQQFVYGTFESSYYPTAKKETHYPSVIHHDHKYNLKIVDIPDIPFFPVSSFYNISDLKAYGLRDANAYILVFDLLCPDSFEYVSGMYSQISESRDLGKVPVVVVGNKTDKVNDNIYKSRHKSRRDSDEREREFEREHHDHGGGHGGFGGHHGSMFGGHDNGFGGHGSHGFGSHGHDHGFGGGHGGFGGHHDHDHDLFGSSSKKKHKNKKDKHKRDYGFGSSFSSSSSKYDKRDKYSRPSYEINWASMYTPDEYLDKDIADKVTAEWKVIYKETSARDPEAVTDVFKSVMGVFDEVGVRQYEVDDRGHHDNER